MGMDAKRANGGKMDRVSVQGAERVVHIDRRLREEKEQWDEQGQESWSLLMSMSKIQRNGVKSNIHRYTIFETGRVDEAKYDATGVFIQKSEKWLGKRVAVAFKAWGSGISQLSAASPNSVIDLASPHWLVHPVLSSVCRFS